MWSLKGALTESQDHLELILKTSETTRNTKTRLLSNHLFWTWSLATRRTYSVVLQQWNEPNEMFLHSNLTEEKPHLILLPSENVLGCLRVSGRVTEK